MTARKSATRAGAPVETETRQSPLRVTVLGRMSVWSGPHEIALPNRKCRALLAYLALSDSREETREALLGLLWSDADEERARASLRQCLYEVRAALEAQGFTGFQASKIAVTLDRSRIEVDLWSVLETARAGSAHPLLLEREHPIESLLAELESVDPAFRVWLMAKRQALHDRIVRHLEPALRSQSGNVRATLAGALLGLDPTHEEAARALMRLRAESGDLGGALAIYKKLWDLLDTEFDVEPSPETQKLVAALRLAQPDGVPAPAAADQRSARAIRVPERTQAIEATKLIIGVGPFDVSGIASDRCYLAHGFRRELIANLVRFREWSVRDSGPAQADGAASGGTHEYLLEASALQGSGDMRLVVTLRSRATQEYVWSDQCRLTLEAWADSQQLLVQKIATALNIQLSARRLASMRHADPQLKAYDRWLFGQSKLHNWEPASFHEAAQIFEQIIVETPDFSPAYSTLAQMQNSVHFMHPGVFRSDRRTEQALVYAREATRLDPVDSRAQLCLGWAHAMARQHELAEVHHRLAEELNENDHWTATSVALGFAARGQFAEARHSAERAFSLIADPDRDHWAYHQQIRFMTGDYAGSIAAAEPAADVTPVSIAWKIAALGHLGARDSAKAETNRYLAHVRGAWFGHEPPTERNIARWTVHGLPIKRAEDWERLRDGLAAGGLPVGDLVHNAW